jgi:tetratricopeptide (TPR) repeat protein
MEGCRVADVNSRSPDHLVRIIRLCTSALADAPGNHQGRAELLKMRGVAFRNVGDFDSSLKDLDEAVALDSKNADHLRMRAWTLREMGNPARAESDYDRALELEPEWQGYLSRCVTRIDQSNFAGALEDCDKSLALRRIGEALFFSAFALHHLSRSSEALPKIAEACSLDGATFEHFLLLAEIEIALNKHFSARETAAKALQKFPGDKKLIEGLQKLGL